MFVGGKLETDTEGAFLYFLDESEGTITWDILLEDLADSGIAAIDFDGLNGAAIAYIYILGNIKQELLIWIRNVASFEADNSYSISYATTPMDYVSSTD